MTSTRRKQVCLFGLSADPPTGDCGHRGIVSHLAHMEEFDEVRVLPVYSHFFDAKRGKQTDFDRRIEMCRIAFGDLPNVVTSEAERDCFNRAKNALPEEEDISTIRIGTADLLDMFLAEEPNVDFTFTMASDTFTDFTDMKWRRSLDVVKLLQGRILIILRKIGNSDADDEAKWNEVKRRMDKLNTERVWDKNENVVVEGTNEENETADRRRGNTYMENPVRTIQIPSLTAVSSTVIRKSDDELKVRELVHPQVVDYILEHKLYALGGK